MKRRITIILSIVLVITLFAMDIPTVLAKRALPLVDNDPSLTESNINAIDIDKKISNTLPKDVLRSL